MMQRAHGIDISHHQTVFDVTVNRDDIQFIIIRASNGTVKDRRFDQFVVDIAEVPVRGAYHYFRSEHSPLNPAKSYPWQAQAEFFLKCVKDKGFHFFALDFEQSFVDGVPDNEKSPEFARDAQEWMRYVKKETGKPVLLYTNPDKYEHWLMPYGDWMKEWPLWIAQYWDPPRRNKRPRLPKEVREWTFYQYSADTPPNGKGKQYGVDTENVDLNVYKGPVEDLRLWLKLDVDLGLDLPPEFPFGTAEFDPGMLAFGPATYTWRDVLVAARAVSARLGVSYVPWLKEACILDEAKDRNRWSEPYDGKPVDEWPLTSVKDPARVRDEIFDQLQQSGIWQEKAGDAPGYTWREVIMIARKVAESHDQLYLQWFIESGMRKEVGDKSLWDKPYTGVPVDEWKAPILMRMEVKEALAKKLGEEPIVTDPRPQDDASGGVIKLDVPYVSQWDANAATHTADCGPTCLSMIINADPAPAQKVTVDQLYEKYLKDKEKQEYTSWREMVDICRQEGLDPTYKRYERANALAGLKEQLENGRPVVALVNYAPWSAATGIGFKGYHFVLVTGTDNDGVYVHDPLFSPPRREMGRYFRWTNAMFLAGWGDSIAGNNPKYSTVSTTKKVSKKVG
ncbi:MAG: GH25 family lysozyme [Chloroflexota bacterium]|jgi:GH25 family lysozyme M1 (1,4-beta-N-acetylmuramidase)